MKFVCMYRLFAVLAHKQHVAVLVARVVRLLPQRAVCATNCELRGEKQREEENECVRKQLVRVTITKQQNALRKSTSTIRSEIGR